MRCSGRSRSDKSESHTPALRQPRFGLLGAADAVGKGGWKPATAIRGLGAASMPLDRDYSAARSIGWTRLQRHGPGKKQSGMGRQPPPESVPVCRCRSCQPLQSNTPLQLLFFVHESSHPVIPHIFAILVRFCIKLISGACIIEHTFHLASPQMRAFNSPILLSLWVSALVVPAWYRLWNRNRKRCKRSGPWMCYLI